MNLDLLALNNEIFQELVFPAQLRGELSPDVISFNLWNRKDKTCDYLANSIKLYMLNADKGITGGSNNDGQEIIDEKMVWARSNGVIGSGIIDDFQDFQQFGGNTYLELGDIPVNCARTIELKLLSPPDAETEEAFLVLKVEYDYYRIEQYIYAEKIAGGKFIPYFVGGFFI